MDFSPATLLRAQIEGKALGPNPAFMDPRPVGVTDLQLGRRAGGSPSVSTGGKRISQRQAATHLSAYGGDQAMDWIMDCVRYYADAVANADYHFEKPAKLSAVKEPGEPVIPPQALADLFDDPNPYMDYIELMELLVIDLLLVGNAYWLKWRTNSEGQPLAIYRLAPPYVELATGPWGPEAFIYQIPNAEKLVLEPDEVIHMRLANPDPKNPFFGLGIIQGAGRAADLDISLTDSQASYHGNKGLPSLAVESERRVPKDVFNKMRKQLKARVGGPRNAGELLVLESGLKLASIAPNASEAGFGPLTKISRDRIFAMFRINPKMLGITDESSNENVTEAQKQWDTHTARPFMNKLQTKVTNELVDLWTLAYRIDYEAEKTPSEKAEEAQMVGAIPGVKVGEVREAGGLGAHPDKAINEMTINLPGENGGGGGPGETPSRNGFPDKGLAGEAGRPPKPANTKAFPVKGAPLPKGAAVRPAGKALTPDGILDDAYARLAAIEGKAIDTREVHDPLVKDRTDGVDEVTEEFSAELANAADQLSAKLIDAAEGKAVSDIVAKLRSSGAWAGFEAQAKEAYEKALLKVMSSAAIHHDKLGLKPAGEVDYEALIDALVSRQDSGVSAITKTLKDKVSAAAKEARSENPDIAHIQEAVKAAIKQWAEGQANTVALTEATRGYNESTLDVAEKAGATHVLVSDGEDYDEACQEADGSTWTIAKARSNMLEHPNCRRAFVPVTA